MIANENISHFSENNVLVALRTPDYFTQRETASSKQKFEAISVNKIIGIFVSGLQKQNINKTSVAILKRVLIDKIYKC